MPRPPAAPADNTVDAGVCARAGSAIDRHFTAADLPRLSDAGGQAASIDASFQFGEFEGRPTVSGAVRGHVVLTCQRCMQAVSVPLDEGFRVVVVDEDRDDEPGGYEPVVANAARLDLRWLAEEQVLLALPLVPLHERDDDAAESPTGDCTQAAQSSAGAAQAVEPQPSADDEGGEDVRQKPFKNLRDMLRQR